MNGQDLDALDLDARELGALAAFEAEADVFGDLGAPRPGDEALVQRMSAHALTTGASTVGGGLYGLKALAIVGVIAAVTVVGVALRSTDDDRVGAPATSDAAIDERLDPALPTPRVAPTPMIAPASRPLPVVETPIPTARPVSAAVKSAARPSASPRFVAPAATTTAAELLREGNAARRAGEFSRARDIYTRLRREFPGTREDLLVRVSFGQLALEELDDPALALRQFGAYLEDRPDGTLAEEASIGRISALRRLGRANEERRALEQFVGRFPDSIHVRALQERRDELTR